MQKHVLLLRMPESLRMAGAVWMQCVPRRGDSDTQQDGGGVLRISYGHPRSLRAGRRDRAGWCLVRSAWQWQPCGGWSRELNEQ